MKQELIDIEKAQCQSISDITKITELLLDMQGAKLEYMEPITNGSDDKEIRGLIMYFVQTNGEQIAVEVYPPDELDKLIVNAYTKPVKQCCQGKKLVGLSSVINKKEI